jgi:hypothetical protein
MAFSATSGAVTDAATPVPITETGSRQGVSCILRNVGSTDFWLGGSNVDTTTNGFPLYVGEAQSINLNGSDTLYLRCAAGKSGSYALLKQDD